MSDVISEKCVAQSILDGFDGYRHLFREITREAPRRFEQALWQEIQAASAERITLYETMVQRCLADIMAQVSEATLLNLKLWPGLKKSYMELISERSDDELSETWYNSIFCGLFSYDVISDRYMFVQSTRPSTRQSNHVEKLKLYNPNGDLVSTIKTIFNDLPFSQSLYRLDQDVNLICHQLSELLPNKALEESSLTVEIFHSLFYRNKGAYLVGRVFNQDTQWPMLIALVHHEGLGIAADALITDPADVSIIFSFTRSYFMVEMQVPADLIAFLRILMPGKSLADLYTSVGFYRHGKSEFYRSLIHHLQHSDDLFDMAPGVRGMVMSVFTLPGFKTVFKVIKDRFSPSKMVDRATVIEKYRLVKTHDRVGRMADTQEFAEFRFPASKFVPSCLDELLEVASSTVSMEGDQVLIQLCWTERRMTPLNIYLETSNALETEDVLNDYGLAIKQLAAANIFPGDMLLKNFGVTRHGRVIFYDYDEINYLTEINFRDIPPPSYPEDEMSGEPWYSVGPLDVFPEEFPVFLFTNPEHRKTFTCLHGNLFKADYWKSLQTQILNGQVIDVFPYKRPHQLQDKIQ